MSTSTKDLSSAVPVLDGTNYRVWKIQMSNFLRAKGLWQYVQGLVPRPEDAAPTGTTAAPIAPTAQAIEEAAEKQLAWDIKDDEANGLIMLKVAYSLHGATGDLVLPHVGKFEHHVQRSRCRRPFQRLSKGR